jgi:hypothetical protein
MGMLLMYMMSRAIFPPLKENLPPVDDYTEEIVAIFLNGLKIN